MASEHPDAVSVRRSVRLRRAAAAGPPDLWPVHWPAAARPLLLQCQSTLRRRWPHSRRRLLPDARLAGGPPRQQDETPATRHCNASARRAAVPAAAAAAAAAAATAAAGTHPPGSSCRHPLSKPLTMCFRGDAGLQTFGALQAPTRSRILALRTRSFTSTRAARHVECEERGAGFGQVPGVCGAQHA